MPATGTATTASKTRSSRSRHDNDANPDMSLPTIGNYAFEKTIGQGNFAKVKLAKHKLTNQEVAIKIIDKTMLDEKKLGKLHREVRIMKMLNHPNIVKLYEVIETKHTLFLVMEYVSGGELYDYLVAHGRMKEKDARAKFRQILSAVHFCHKKRIIHRDLKAENLLLDSDFNIKIADFGFSNNYQPDGQLDTFCGSPPYAAPELFQGRKYTGPEVDVWSLGVIMYVLCTGCLPFDGKDLKEMREVVCRGRYKVPFYLSDGCEKLLRKFLVREPSKRANLGVVKNDPWIMEGFNDSPIKDDMEADIQQDPDEEIMRFMSDKFSFSRDQIVNCLDEKTYDDVSAIYMLLAEQKQSGKWMPYQSGVSPISPVQLQQGTMTPVSRAPLMQTIGENGASKSVRAPANAYKQANTAAIPERRERAASMSAARKRPQTWAEPPSDDFTVYSEKPNVPPQVQRETASLPRPSNIQPQQQPNVAYPAYSTPNHARHSTIGAVPVPGISNNDSAIQSPLPSSSRRGVMSALRSIGRRFSESTSSSAAAAAAAAANMQAGDGHERPRVLRFTFNSNTTSSKNPEDIVRNVILACQKNGLQYSLNGRFLIECSWMYKDAPPLPQADGNGRLEGKELQKALEEIMNEAASTGNVFNKDIKDSVRFDIEVCELPRLKNLHGLRFKRIGGPSTEYKEICSRILKVIDL